MESEEYQRRKKNFGLKSKNSATNGIKYTSVSGEEVDVLYTPDYIENINYLSEIGFPDAPLSEGEIGICGVSISSLLDMEILFDKIPLDKVSTSMTINSPAAMIFTFYLAVAKKQNVNFNQLRGTLQNDILKEYIAQKEYIYPPEPSFGLL